MKNQKILFMTQAAMIAAVYVVLTVSLSPISFSGMQIRISEALTILPAFTPAAIPGLFIGCLLANTFAGAVLPDIILGSIATLIGAVFTYLLRNQNKLLIPLPPIISNMILIPLLLRYAYGVPLPIPVLMLSVGIGEILSCGVLGLALYFALYKYKNLIFKTI